MKLLNLACGAVRDQSETWTNLDMLRPYLAEGTPERRQLDSEPRYVEHDLSDDAELPFEHGSFDGILASHVIEHFSLFDGVKLIEKCYRLLRSGGVLVTSVPDASYFRSVYDEDTVENAVRLFGEPIHLPDGEVTFFRYALFYRQHLTIFTEDSMWCSLTRGGFDSVFRIEKPYDSVLTPVNRETGESQGGEVFVELRKLLNRIPFSLVMAGIK